MSILLGLTLAAVLILLILMVLLLLRMRRGGMDQIIYQELSRSRQETINTMSNSFAVMGDVLSDSIRESAMAQDRRLADLNHRFSNMAVENEVKLDNIRDAMEQKIGKLTEENNIQLERMRDTVDEKLQKTLDEKLAKSFAVVSERLEEVYKGLGEMQNLASGVGDLKKVLTNVKTRGILGEVQLKAILENILSPEQYGENIATVPGSSERVEFAIRLPGDENGPVYLPIDAKFPLNRYADLQDAYDSGDKRYIEESGRQLDSFICQSAKKIHDKYVDPPHTTDFAILFLPSEGLYAEVVRRGMVEKLQKDYKVNIAGPTTMAALLNSLQMGFRTLAIEKHSSEVWEVLGAVKTEFGKFETALKKAQDRIHQAGNEIESLIGTRTNMMNRSLREIEALPEYQSDRVLGINREDV